MSTFISPPVTPVTATEAAQSGLSAGNTRKLTSEQKMRVDRFAKAHLSKTATPIATASEQAKTAALQKPQVSADEQVAAVGLMGTARTQPRRTQSKNTMLYKALFKGDDDYLELDLQNFRERLANNSQSYVDLSDWPDDQKSLRKYLLANIILESKTAEPDLRGQIQTLQTKLLADHGEFIRGSILAVEVGKTLKLSPLKLKDFVRAYQMLDIPPNDGRTPELILLFRSLRKSIDAGQGTKDMVKLCNGLYAVLKREKSQHPSKLTSTRQHILLSNIKHLRTLAIVKSKHTQFLNTCKKAKLYALPSLGELMNTCLQITVGGDTIVGTNALAKMAGAVGTKKPNAQNMFIPHYNRFILQSSELIGLFRTQFHQKQVGDHIVKSIQSNSILN